MSARRVTAAHVAGLAASLTARDWLILAILRRVRVATAQQLTPLCFPDNTPLSGARMARRTLRQLVGLRVLVRLDRAPGGLGGGSRGDVYALDVAGLRLLARADGRESRAIRRPWPVSRQFLNHALQITRWYCRLAEAERHGGSSLLDFTTEPRCWRTFTTAAGAATLKPDAFVRLGAPGWELRLFLEIDCATEGPAALRRQLDLYIRYWQTGTEQARHEVFPQVVWIVPDERRHAQLVDLLGRLPPETWPLFRVATETTALDLLMRLASSP